jgi:hypothetical protein
MHPPHTTTGTAAEIRLLALFQKLLDAHAAQSAATSARESDDAHDHVRRTEEAIRKAPIDGSIIGVTVKLGLWKSINGHHDVASEQAEAAYAALVQIGGGRDFAAELDEVVR